MSKRLTTSEFISRAIEVHGDKYDYSKVDYATYTTKICIICKDHGEFWQTPANHLYGYGCNICSNSYTKTTTKFIAEAISIHGNRYDYTKTIYLGCHKKVIVTCESHGDFECRASHHLQGSGCPICKSSKGELLISKWLNNKNISNVPQHRFGDCKRIRSLPYDFYLPAENICIEFDGEQHYFPKFGQDEFLRTQSNDKIKTEYCLRNNIRLLRIPYWEIDNIETILTSLCGFRRD